MRTFRSPSTTIAANGEVGPVRAFAVSVPQNAPVGEYAASLVLIDANTFEELDREPFTFTLPANGVVVASGATEWTLLEATPLGSPEALSPEALSLDAPSPNPARGVVTLAYAVPASGEASVVVYDARGREVAVAARGQHEAGQYAARVDLGALAPGVYVARLSSSGASLVQRFTVVR